MHDQPVVIVIFGAAVRPDGTPSNTLRRRVEAAAAFGARQKEPIFIPTGAAGRHGPPEAVVMAQLLQGLGVPETRIMREETGTDTFSSVRAVARLLRRHGHSGPVYAASSAYHLPRCVALLMLAGCRARACPPPPVPAARDFRRRWYWRLREGAALPWDVSLMVAARLADLIRRPRA
jgi:uncharacterized SAM-binding protein YcdF (DUF218 family)